MINVQIIAGIICLLRLRVMHMCTFRIRFPMYLRVPSISRVSNNSLSCLTSLCEYIIVRTFYSIIFGSKNNAFYTKDKKT